ncbi:MAG: hypothetical protein ACHP84_04755 [Caulobacterales bacterium]
MARKVVRNLAHLQTSASSSRVLNLLRVHERWSRNPDHAENPFFVSPTLNRSIILKHRLRRHEADLFHDGRSIATKIIVPIDVSDLRLGGRSVLVGQQGYDSIMENRFGAAWLEGSDRQLLQILDELPSLDPFYLRERLRAVGRRPARCYFDLGDADMNRLYRFAQHEVQGLIELSYAGIEPGQVANDDRNRGARLARKILSIAVDAETEPLRQTLRLERADYQEGVFCWKGCLYYKWLLSHLEQELAAVQAAVGTVRAGGGAEPGTRTRLEQARRNITHAIQAATFDARTALRVYDTAFAMLTAGDPTAFRDFLLGAPDIFGDLGERLGALGHVASYWTYRFPNGHEAVASPDELLEIFADFERSLTFRAPAPRPDSAGQTPASHASTSRGERSLTTASSGNSASIAG